MSRLWTPLLAVVALIAAAALIAGALGAFRPGCRARARLDDRAALHGADVPDLQDAARPVELAAGQPDPPRAGAPAARAARVAARPSARSRPSTAPEVLADTPRSGFGALAWLAPTVLLLAGGGLAVLLARRWRGADCARRRRSQTPSATGSSSSSTTSSRGSSEPGDARSGVRRGRALVRDALRAAARAGLPRRGRRRVGRRSAGAARGGADAARRRAVRARLRRRVRRSSARSSARPGRRSTTGASQVAQASGILVVAMGLVLAGALPLPSLPGLTGGPQASALRAAARRRVRAQLDAVRRARARRGARARLDARRRRAGGAAAGRLRRGPRGAADRERARVRPRARRGRRSCATATTLIRVVSGIVLDRARAAGLLRPHLVAVGGRQPRAARGRARRLGDVARQRRCGYPRVAWRSSTSTAPSC